MDEEKTLAIGAPKCAVVCMICASNEVDPIIQTTIGGC